MKRLLWSFLLLAAGLEGLRYAIRAGRKCGAVELEKG